MEWLRKIIARIVGEEYTPPDCPNCLMSRADRDYWQHLANTKHLTSYPTVRAEEVLLVDQIVFRHDNRIFDGEVVETYYDGAGKFVLVLKPGFYFTNAMAPTDERPRGTHARSKSHIAGYFPVDPGHLVKVTRRFS